MLSGGVCRSPLCAHGSGAGCHSGEPQHTSTLWPQAAKQLSQNDPAAAVLPTTTSYKRRDLNRGRSDTEDRLDPRPGRCASSAESDLSTGSNEQSGSPLRRSMIYMR